MLTPIMAFLIPRGFSISTPPWDRHEYGSSNLLLRHNGADTIDVGVASFVVVTDQLSDSRVAVLKH